MNSDFLFNDNFISAAKENFENIVFESTFNDKENDFLGAISYYTRQEKKLLIVASKTPVDIIFPIIQSGKSKTTLINPSCGLLGFSNKGFWDVRDITKAKDFGLDVYEIAYQEQILDLFKKNQSSCYIRLNEHIPYKEQLPEVNIESLGITSFQKHGYSGSNGTIICFGSLLIDVLYGAGFLQEQGHAVDVFVGSQLFFKIDNDLKESLQRTEKLIIIIDQHLGSLYESWIKATLFEIGLSNVSIKFITPSYQSVSSVAIEYMYEQAKIDGFNITQRIK
ncbi:MAG: hypothetical protein PHR61_04260 [Candidatus Absconditabacteria bacterium]|nr:hypothetical protein [Candidatus Absconditabacteria bacterium]